MNFIVGKIYIDRINREWQCISPIFGSLPTFKNKEEKTIVQSRDGKYRFDDLPNDRDLIGELNG